jgi:GntR family transcriptional regulator/MocR family aminotransferase
MVPPRGARMIFLDRNSKEPLYMQIYLQLKKEILDGELKEDQVLVGSRGLAKILDVSRNTVDNAYSQLLAEGYITPKKGIGYIVLKVPEIKGRNRPWIPNVSAPTKDEKRNQQEVLYDLTNSSHTSELFPKNLWKRYTLECLQILESEAKLSSYQDKQGELYLRRNLLSYLKRIRGVWCDESQIVITCGIQQSLDYICTMLSYDSSTILIEEPGYNKAVAVFVNNGMNVQTVPVDENGIVVSKLPVIQDVCAVYSTPSHQFPTGVTLPVGRRVELLEWANQNDTYIIEDDFDSELKYYAKPIPSLQSIDVHDCVIYLGTFSKALSPSIRMGYMILPPQLKEVYMDKFENFNSTVPLLNQYIIGRLIETGQYDRHIRRLNHVFRKRLELFLAEFSDVKEKIKILSNGSGQYFLIEFSVPTNQEQLIEKAFKYGVRVYSTMQFWQDKAECPPNTLFLGFSKIDMKDIPDCVSRLKKAWAEWL